MRLWGEEEEEWWVKAAFQRWNVFTNCKPIAICTKQIRVCCFQLFYQGFTFRFAFWSVFLLQFSSQEIPFSYFLIVVHRFLSPLLTKYIHPYLLRKTILSVMGNNLVLIIMASSSQITKGRPSPWAYFAKASMWLNSEEKKKLWWTAVLIEPTLMWGRDKSH